MSVTVNDILILAVQDRFFALFLFILLNRGRVPICMATMRLFSRRTLLTTANVHADLDDVWLELVLLQHGQIVVGAVRVMPIPVLPRVVGMIVRCVIVVDLREEVIVGEVFIVVRVMVWEIRCAKYCVLLVVYWLHITFYIVRMIELGVETRPLVVIACA